MALQVWVAPVALQEWAQWAVRPLGGGKGGQGDVSIPIGFQGPGRGRGGRFGGPGMGAPGGAPPGMGGPGMGPGGMGGQMGFGRQGASAQSQATFLRIRLLQTFTLESN